MNRKVITLLFSVLALAVEAQQITVPYQFGFEATETVEMSNWVLNEGSQAAGCLDQWVVGTSVKNGGHQSLYISTNGGVDNYFGAKPDVVYAYRDFVLPQGSYDISFDWRCFGTPSGSSLNVGVGVAAQINCASDSTTGNAERSGNLVWCKTDTRDMNGKTGWQNASISVNSNGSRVLRLFFCWANNNRDTALANPIGAAIDNIQITSSNCRKPISITAEQVGCDTVNVSWRGTSEQYQMEYRRRGSTTWRRRSGIYGNSITVDGLDEGMYDFRVRGICNNVDTSAYTYAEPLILFCAEKHCIDYVTLVDNPDVTCYYGKFAQPDANLGVVNYGSDDQRSRHTVNWDPDDYDIRTGGRLAKVPEGELASVRLGNWLLGAEAERISYAYTVDSAYSILLLKYAVVLEDPSHSVKDQPRFTLDILDEYGRLIDPTCGAADFHADRTREGWNSIGDVTWKDWTVVGLNLEDYVGRTLTIQLTTYDCSWSGHFGYAYFTIGCSAARIQGLSCGDEANLSIQAPDGFNYVWYDKYNNVVDDSYLSDNGKVLSVPSSDTTTYRCRLSYKENMSCYFDLFSAVLPRYPVSDFTWTYSPEQCENRVRFANKSHILTKFEGNVEHHYDQKCEDYRWTFPDGSTSDLENPIFAFPNEGGTFAVKLESYLSDMNCVHDTTFYLTLPAIGSTIDTIYQSICYGDYIAFGRQIVAETGVYTDSLHNAAGCDSVMVLNLTVNPQSYTAMPAETICYGERLCIDGDCYRADTTGLFVRFLKNVYGCDSTLQTPVTVLDEIKPEIQTDQVLNKPNSGKFTISGTGFTSYTITWLNGNYHDSLPASTTLVEDLPGGNYTVVFYNDFGCTKTMQATILFECLEATVTQPAYACGDATIEVPYTILKGMATNYSVEYDAKALAAGFVNQSNQPMDGTSIKLQVPADPWPDHYTAKLIMHDLMCDADTFDLYFTINYTETIAITQRWNDFLAVRQAAADKYGNFVAYQWYKNGQPILGETRSQYYAPTEGLDMTATYSVELTRQSDGVAVISCDITPTDQPKTTTLTVKPTALSGNQSINVRTNTSGKVKMYNHLGMVVGTYVITEGDNHINNPGATGVYMLQALFDNGDVRMQKIVVE
ncbi:MAG: fibronectin type III domain-containing protein [Paludibacteraceae bacterium]|nr:fibronectin type III domain-containing protein [Paludibacteraceae bacterium]